MDQTPDIHQMHARRMHLGTSRRTVAGYVEFGRQLIALKGNTSLGGFPHLLQELGVDRPAASSAMSVARTFDFHLVRLIDSVTRLAALLVVDENALALMPQDAGRGTRSEECQALIQKMRTRRDHGAPQQAPVMLSDDEARMLDNYRSCPGQVQTVVAQTLKVLAN